MLNLPHRRVPRALAILLLAVGPAALANDSAETLRQLTDKANAGDAKAMYALSVELQRDKLGKIDLPAAQKWLEKAAAAGNTDAMDRLGEMFLVGDGGVNVDLAAARKWFKSEADAGGAWGYFNLADCYDTAKGIAQDSEQAKKLRDQGVKIAQAAADKGDAAGLCSLGYAYEHGYGVAKDVKKSLELLKKAAAAGDVIAMNEIGFLYNFDALGKPDLAASTRWYLKAADAGYAFAMVNAACNFVRATDPRDLDYDKSLALLKKAIEAGNCNALAMLGDAYKYGLGVSPDLARAIALYRKSAEAGDTAGQGYLGLAYLNGEGVDKDEKQGIDWLQKGIAQGDTSSMCALAAYHLTQQTADDEKKARALYSSAAKLNDETAQKWLTAHPDPGTTLP